MGWHSRVHAKYFTIKELIDFFRRCISASTRRVYLNMPPVFPRRYQYYIDHDDQLAESVATLQPTVIAGILRKGMQGLLVSGSCGDGGGGSGGHLGGLFDFASSQVQ